MRALPRSTRAALVNLALRHRRARALARRLRTEHDVDARITIEAEARENEAWNALQGTRSAVWAGLERPLTDRQVNRLMDQVIGHVAGGRMMLAYDVASYVASARRCTVETVVSIARRETL